MVALAAAIRTAAAAVLCGAPCLPFCHTAYIDILSVDPAICALAAEHFIAIATTTILLLLVLITIIIIIFTILLLLLLIIIIIMIITST